MEETCSSALDNSIETEPFASCLKWARVLGLTRLVLTVAPRCPRTREGRSGGANGPEQTLRQLAILLLSCVDPSRGIIRVAQRGSSYSLSPHSGTSARLAVSAARRVKQNGVLQVSKLHRLAASQPTDGFTKRS